MQKLFELLLALNYKIASCESLTGGLFMARLTEVPHVSKVFIGGVVSYQNEIKEKIVGVDEQIVNEYGVVSRQCAEEMACHVKEMFMADVAVSFTGNAGPTSMEGKPAGLVYTCIAIKDRVYPFCDQIDLPRNQLRDQIVELTADRLYDLLLLEKGNSD